MVVLWYNETSRHNTNTSAWMMAQHIYSIRTKNSAQIILSVFYIIIYILNFYLKI